MNSTLKSLLFWMVLIVVGVLIWNFSYTFQRTPDAIPFSVFLAHVEKREVQSVTITGSEITESSTPRALPATIPLLTPVASPVRDPSGRRMYSWTPLTQRTAARSPVSASCQPTTIEPSSVIPLPRVGRFGPGCFRSSALTPKSTVRS